MKQMSEVYPPFTRDSDQGHTHSLLLNPNLKLNPRRVARLKEMSFSIIVSELASENMLYLTLLNVVNVYARLTFAFYFHYTVVYISCFPVCV